MSSYDKELGDLSTTEPSSVTDSTVVGSPSNKTIGSSPTRSNSLPQFTSAVTIDLKKEAQGVVVSPTGEELPQPSVSSHNVDSDAAPEMAKTKKYLSLVVLVVQNTALVLTMRYSRTVTSGPLYLASTAVVLTELVKFVICVAMITRINDFDPARTITMLKTEIIDKKAETLRLSVPSVLYTIQNNLLYIALTHLDAATFQVCKMVCSAVTNLPASQLQ